MFLLQERSAEHKCDEANNAANDGGSEHGSICAGIVARGASVRVGFAGGGSSIVHAGDDCIRALENVVVVFAGA